MKPSSSPLARMRTAAGACALAAFSACQAFAPTIPERADTFEGRPFVLPERIELPAPDPSWAVQHEAGPPPELQWPRVADDRLLSFELRGLALSQALHLVGEAAGVNLYLDAALAGEVDASFPSISLDDALRVLLEQNQLRLVEEPEGVYWVEPNDGSEEASAWFRVRSLDVSAIEEDLRVLAGDDAVLIVNADQNFVMVRGTANDVENVADYLAAADRLKRQVLLEVELVEVIFDDRLEFGVTLNPVDADVGPGAVSIMQNLAGSTQDFTVSLTNNTVPIDAVFDAISEHAALNLLSSPRVQTVTGSQAIVQIKTEVPFIESTNTTNVGGANGSTATTNQVQFKEVGIKMDVLPVVQEGGVVAIHVEQELSEVVDFFQGIPVVDTRTITTDLLAADGSTVVLGGLLQNRAIEADRGVPILEDLPFIGRAFRGDEDSSQQRELLLLITPRVLEPSQAAALAGTYRTQYRERLQWGGAPRLDGGE